MAWLVLSMVVVLVIAAAVVVYVAFPHRGQQVPHAPWLGRAMRGGVHRLPTLDNQREPERTPHRRH